MTHLAVCTDGEYTVGDSKNTGEDNSGVATPVGWLDPPASYKHEHKC
jgi:hypothetical protein